MGRSFVEHWAFVDCCAFADLQGPVDCRAFEYCRASVDS